MSHPPAPVKWVALASGGVILMILAGLFALVLSRRPAGSSGWEWKYETTTSSGPADLGKAMAGMTMGMPATEVKRLLGTPDSVDADGDVELWNYVSRCKTVTERWFLGLIKVGGGSRSKSQSGCVGFEKGLLVYGTQPDLANPASRVASRKIERLRSWSADPKVQLPSSGKSLFQQLGLIRLGKTTAHDLEELLGKPREVRWHDSLETWGYSVREPSTSPIIIYPTRFGIGLKDGVVVDSPRIVCEDEELLKRFDDADTWPLR